MTTDRDQPDFAGFPLVTSSLLRPGEFVVTASAVANWARIDRRGRRVLLVVLSTGADGAAPGDSSARNSELEIMDDIDVLVAQRMEGGEPRTGYDYNDPTFPSCPNPWCGEPWHGLPITMRMAEMRDDGELDPTYRYAGDDSPVLCPGSLHEGEYTRPPTPASHILPTDWRIFGAIPGRWYAGGRGKTRLFESADAAFRWVDEQRASGERIRIYRAGALPLVLYVDPAVCSHSTGRFVLGDQHGARAGLWACGLGCGTTWLTETAEQVYRGEIFPRGMRRPEPDVVEQSQRRWMMVHFGEA